MDRNEEKQLAWQRWLAETAPILPDQFDDYVPPFEIGRSPKPPLLVVMTGVPGTGKTAIADKIGSSLGVPVFAFDWLLGAILPRLPGPVDMRTLGAMGFELLVTLALRQIAFGQSAVIDVPIEHNADRQRLESLARRFHARLKVIECVCSDEKIHRSRLQGRMRWIPGWNQTVKWSDHLVSRREAFQHWEADTLVLDAVAPLDENIHSAITFVRES